MPGRHSVPSYRRHKSSGQAVVTLPDPFGTRRDYMLGAYNSPESRAEYERVVAEWLARGRRHPPSPSAGGDLTVNELLVLFLAHADSHYRRGDGTATDEADNVRYAVWPLRETHGRTPAASFGPLALKAVRRSMVAAGLSRGLVNQRIGIIKRVFRWAVGEELVPPSVAHGLAAVQGLQKGRTEAREPEPVGPPPEGAVEATLPKLNDTARAMVELQRLTGMRPGEVCSLRPGELDRSGAVWWFVPGSHKTAHRNRGRAVPIGPKGQAVLSPWLEGRTPDEYVFNPARARRRFDESRTSARRSKPTPRQSAAVAASASKPVPNKRYSTTIYAQAVRRAALTAGVPHWHPNQLRHEYATTVRRTHGLEAAQAALGHAKGDVTQIYAERDKGLAERVARELG